MPPNRGLPRSLMPNFTVPTPRVVPYAGASSSGSGSRRRVQASPFQSAGATERKTAHLDVLLRSPGNKSPHRPLGYVAPRTEHVRHQPAAGVGGQQCAQPGVGDDRIGTDKHVGPALVAGPPRVPLKSPSGSTACSYVPY